MNESDLIRNSDFLRTESIIDPKIPVQDLIAHLKKRRTSGTVSIDVDLKDGGIRAIRLAESTRIQEPHRDSVRKILKME